MKRFVITLVIVLSLGVCAAIPSLITVSGQNPNKTIRGSLSSKKIANWIFRPRKPGPPGDLIIEGFVRNEKVKLFLANVEGMLELNAVAITPRVYLRWRQRRSTPLRSLRVNLPIGKRTVAMSVRRISCSSLPLGALASH